MRRLRTLAVLGTVLVTALTGCAGLPWPGASSSGGTPAPAPRRAHEVIAAAATALGKAKTYQVAFSYRRTTGKRTTRLKGRMAYGSEPRPTFDFDLGDIEVDGMEQPGGLRVRQFGTVAYVRMGKFDLYTADRPWIRVTGYQRTGLGLEYFLYKVHGLNGFEHLRMLTASVDAVQVGRERLEGAPAVRYRGTYGIQSGLRRVDDGWYDAMGENVAGVREVGFDLWLDDGGLPRKLHLRETRLPYEKVGDLALVLRFDAIDRPLEITRPPSTETMTARQLLARLRRTAS